VIHAVPVSLDVQRRIETGLPFSWGNANFVPNVDDPDSRRASRFLSGATAFTYQLAPRVSYRLSYHKVYTKRQFDDGPAGTQFPPPFSVSDHIIGGTDTADARIDVQLAPWHVLSAGYEFERETFRSDHFDLVPAPLASNASTTAGQRDHSVFFGDQLRLMHDRLQIGVSGRMHFFDLVQPEFTGAAPVYTGVRFTSPPRAKTGDIAAAYFLPKSGTKLRAHVGNGYRAPSIYERFGSSFFFGSFTPFGDPRLSPERTVAFDMGVDQYLFNQKLRASATWFYTNLQETIQFDFSGLINPATDLFGRFGGYLNTGGGIARGAEISIETRPWSTLTLNGAYTFTNSDLRKSQVVTNDFFRAGFSSPHQFSLVATQRIGKRIDAIADFWAAGEHTAIYSGRAFSFDGARKLDLALNYTLPVSERLSVRFYGKMINVTGAEYFEAGYRTPGRWGTGGLNFQF
jgi:iron complex outermembrane receptor protein